MDFQFLVSVNVDREQGKFASRETIAEVIQGALDDANPGDITTDEDATYTVNDWTVDEQAIPKRPRVRRPSASQAAVESR